MRNVLTFILLLTSLFLQAQYFQAQLQLTDGSILQGYAKLPSNKLFENSVKFKSTEKGKAEKIKDSELSKILITSKQGVQFLFERLNVVHLFKSLGKDYEMEKTKKHWQLRYHTNDVLNCYALAQRYKLDKNGTMHSITGANSMWEFLYFTLQRHEEDKTYIVNAKGFSHKQVRKAMALFFKDHPEFVERIENKDFKNANVSDVADAYAALKS